MPTIENTTETVNVPAVDTAAPIVAPAATDTAKPAKPRRAKPAAKASGKPNKPAKPVKAANVAEAKPDPRAAKLERLAADRKAIDGLYAVFEAQRASVPVKSFNGSTKPQATTAHPIARGRSARQAAAIAVAFSAAGKKLANGATAPRVFERNGVRSFIENGVLRDAVSSGLISVSGTSPETETLTLRVQPAVIIGLIGERAAKAGKLV